MIINTDFLLNQIYPVGSLYITTNEANPSNFLGGTSADHKIPIESMPSHSHMTPHGGGASETGVPFQTLGHLLYEPTSGYGTSTTATGGGQAYYPYYYGVYVWKRVA